MVRKCTCAIWNYRNVAPVLHDLRPNEQRARYTDSDHFRSYIDFPPSQGRTMLKQGVNMVTNIGKSLKTIRLPNACSSSVPLQYLYDKWRCWNSTGNLGDWFNRSTQKTSGGIIPPWTPLIIILKELLFTEEIRRGNMSRYVNKIWWCDWVHLLTAPSPPHVMNRAGCAASGDRSLISPDAKNHHNTGPSTRSTKHDDCSIRVAGDFDPLGKQDKSRLVQGILGSGLWKVEKNKRDLNCFTSIPAIFQRLLNPILSSTFTTFTTNSRYGYQE